LKQLILENGRVVVKELPDPTPDTYEVVVANAYSAVSIGTERSMLMSARKGSGFQKYLICLRMRRCVVRPLKF